MEVYLQELLSEIGYNLPGFQRGFAIGVAVLFILLVLLRLLIVFLNPRRRKCQGVDTTCEDGALFISSSAISDLISAQECEFDGIRFTKSILYKRKSKYYIKLNAELETKEVNFPDLISTIREKIFNSLKKNLGINCVDKIDIIIRKVNSNY
jgi:hypothetical protein